MSLAEIYYLTFYYLDHLGNPERVSGSGLVNASHIMSCHLHILVIYLRFHAYKYLRSGYGNYKDTKVL